MYRVVIVGGEGKHHLCKEVFPEEKDARVFAEQEACFDFGALVLKPVASYTTSDDTWEEHK